MRGFILGVIVTIVVLFGIGLAVADLGFLPSNADTTPPPAESRFAMNALDASIARHAPRVNNPVPASDENLIDGMKIYTMNCALCHGTMDLKPSVLEHSMYPPPPQFLLDPSDDPEWHNFYAIRNGVRYAGMPAWNKALSEQDMWKVTAFLSRVDKLPPAAIQYWKNAYGTAPQPHEQEQNPAHGHME